MGVHRAAQMSHGAHIDAFGHHRRPKGVGHERAGTGNRDGAHPGDLAGLALLGVSPAQSLVIDEHDELGVGTPGTVGPLRLGLGPGAGPLVWGPRCRILATTGLRSGVGAPPAEAPTARRTSSCRASAAYASTGSLRPWRRAAWNRASRRGARAAWSSAPASGVVCRPRFQEPSAPVHVGRPRWRRPQQAGSGGRVGRGGIGDGLGLGARQGPPGQGFVGSGGGGPGAWRPPAPRALARASCPKSWPSTRLGTGRRPAARSGTPPPEHPGGTWPPPPCARWCRAPTTGRSPRAGGSTRGRGRATARAATGAGSAPGLLRPLHPASVRTLTGSHTLSRTSADSPSQRPCWSLPCTLSSTARAAEWAPQLLSGFGGGAS